MFSETELEEEIRTELEKLEQMFHDDTRIESCSVVNSPNLKPNRVSYSAYEYAEAEGEKEELEDKLKLLITKTEDFSTQMEHMQSINADLQYRNNNLMAENGHLYNKIKCIADQTGTTAPLDCNIANPISPGSRALEMLLADTRAKLARMEASYQEMCLANDLVVQELENERALRVHVGE